MTKKKESSISEDYPVGPSNMWCRLLEKQGFRLHVEDEIRRYLRTSKMWYVDLPDCSVKVTAQFTKRVVQYYSQEFSLHVYNIFSIGNPRKKVKPTSIRKTVQV